jgi:hypothetical protein
MAFIAEDFAATTNVDGKTRQTIAPRLREHLQKIAEQRAMTSTSTRFPLSLASGCPRCPIPCSTSFGIPGCGAWFPLPSI